MGVYQFKLPDVGEGMHEGEIAKWHIKPGDTVEEEQVILEVQNDKSVVELPSPVHGKVINLLVKEGTVSVVGDVLATFEVDNAGNADTAAAEKTPVGNPSPNKAAAVNDDSAKANALRTSPVEADGIKTSSAEPGAENENAVKATDRSKVLATPGVRKLAREEGIDISQVKGSGRHGQVTREDLLKFGATGATGATEREGAAGTAASTEAAVSAANPGDNRQAPAAVPTVAAGERTEERVPLKGIRKIIANAMVKSMYTAPHVTIMDEVDVSKLVELREKAKPLAEKKGVKLTYLPFIVKALVAAARQFPVLNASVDDERNEIVYKKFYSIGIATDTDNGLIVPVVHDADRKNIWTIAAEIKDLAVRGREGKLASNEMKGSTITITNIGSAGGMFFTPIINYPEAAILGTGRISEKPVIRNGEIVIGKLMALSVSFDHRIIDGATAQYAVNYIKQLLEDPQLLIMEV